MRGFDISNRRFLQGLKQRALFEAYNGAMDFVNEGFGGPKAAVKSGKFPGIYHQALTRRLKGTVVKAEDDSCSLLSFTEERELALYARTCGENMMGQNREDLCDKVHKARKGVHGRTCALKKTRWTQQTLV
jgi:hypothetical protein